MEFTIGHRTAYAYEHPVSESYTVLHLQPRSDTSQFCTKYELDIEPPARALSYSDRYGNDVQHFAILPEHKRLSIETRSTVMTMLPRDPPLPERATRTALANESLDRFYDFLKPSAYVRLGEGLARYRAELEPPGEAIGEWCFEIARAIHRGFTYDAGATTVQTTVDEALERRAGVCQDYAHVMIALLRSAGVPARYVSGYIFRGDSYVLGAEASHAWCEAYLPPHGWVGFDPTNDLLVDDRFVKIGIGRDYHDVSPVRGVYRGSHRAEMEVNVAMDALAPQPPEATRISGAAGA